MRLSTFKALLQSCTSLGKVTPQSNIAVAKRNNRLICFLKFSLSLLRKNISSIESRDGGTHESSPSLVTSEQRLDACLFTSTAVSKSMSLGF